MKRRLITSTLEEDWHTFTLSNGETLRLKLREIPYGEIASSSVMLSRLKEVKEEIISKCLSRIKDLQEQGMSPARAELKAWSKEDTRETIELTREEFQEKLVVLKLAITDHADVYDHDGSPIEFQKESYLVDGEVYNGCKEEQVMFYAACDSPFPYQSKMVEDIYAAVVAKSTRVLDFLEAREEQKKSATEQQLELL